MNELIPVAQFQVVTNNESAEYGRASGVQLGDYDITHYAAAFGANGIPSKRRLSVTPQFLSARMR